MTALYRCGEHAQALRVYAEVQKVLDDELDTAPGPGLEAIRGLENAKASELGKWL